MSFGVYIGPYLRVPSVTDENVRTSYHCSAGCAGFKDTGRPVRFCEHCGAAVQPQEHRSASHKAPTPWDVPGSQFIDLMWRPESDHRASQANGYAVWLPNQKGYGLSLSTYDGQGEHALDPDQARKSIEVFSKAHSEFILAAERHLGVKPEIHFGVVSYHH